MLRNALSALAAGVEPRLEMDAKRIRGPRVLPGRFVVISQAMGMATGEAP